MRIFQAYYYQFFFFILGVAQCFGQDSLSVEGLDQKYREDQFYVNITYNLLTRVPSEINLKGVSGGVSFGYLRDMPINQERNIAIAIGAGISIDQFGQTLFIGENPDDTTIFNPLSVDLDYKANRFSMASLDIPIEFRWRTSTPNEYKFWRIYTGVRMSYTYWYRAFFSQENNEVGQTDIPEFQPLNFAATISFGYGTFNFYANYTVTPFFKEAYLKSTGEKVEFSPFKIGIIFYIL